jgi:hypothetical protein
MTSQATAVPRKSSIGVALAIIGIVLIILAGGYVAYEKYYRQLNYKLLAFHPLVDVVGTIGLLVLMVGAVLALRRR